RGSDRRELRSGRAADRLRGRQLRRRRLTVADMADKKPVAEFPRPRIMDDRRSLPIALLRAREAVMAYFRPHHRKGRVTEQQWRVIRALYLEGEMEAGQLARRAWLLAPSLSRILKDLEAAKYIRRRPGESDSRHSLVSLSPRGRAMVT